MKMKERLDQITLTDYNECVNGNTSVLFMKFLPFANIMRKKSDAMYVSISDKLNDATNGAKSNIMVAMFTRMKLTELRLKAYLMAYDVLLKVESNVIMKRLEEFSFTWNYKASHYDNMYKLSGKINQTKSILDQIRNDYGDMSDMAMENKSTLEDAVVMINNVINGTLTMKSTLAEFSAGSKLMKKIAERDAANNQS